MAEERQEWLQQELKRRLLDDGYDDIMDFSRRTGLIKLISFETIRRCFNSSDRPIHPFTAALVMRHLGYEIPEIRKTMIELGDTAYHTLLTDGKEQPVWAQALGDAVDALESVSPGALQDVADMLRVIGRARGVDIGAHISRINSMKGKTARTRRPNGAKESPSAATTEVAPALSEANTAPPRGETRKLKVKE